MLDQGQVGLPIFVAQTQNMTVHGVGQSHSSTSECAILWTVSCVTTTRNNTLFWGQVSIAFSGRNTLKK